MIARADGLLLARLEREQAEQARADADLETARKQKLRAHAEARREIAERYADSFA